MTTYRYLCTQRPPMPGGIPNGAVNVGYTEYTAETPGGHVVHVWGAVEYDRPLTPEEECNYELIFDGEDYE